MKGFFKLLSILFLVSCGCQRELVPSVIVSQESLAASKASLVSIQSSGGQTAEITIKSSSTVAADEWALTGQTNSGTSLVLPAGSTQNLTSYKLTIFQARELQLGQTYRFKLQFLYNGKDTLVVERSYTHTLATNWHQKAFISFTDGEFTGMLAANSPAGAGQSESLLLYRFVDEQQYNRISYSLGGDTWQVNAFDGAIEHRIVLFSLTKTGFAPLLFWGLGYTMADRIPVEKVYTKKFASPRNLTPDYAGENGQTALFTTPSQAFFLTQQGSPALWIRDYDWSQRRGRDLPEQPGTLATFTIGSTGYVVNQLVGKPPRLWAYDPTLDQWTPKADCPAPARQWGVAFSAGGKGYFGAGVTREDGQGLRDIWQYDPILNTWQYHSDYPGQGNRDLIYYSLASKAYLGWGYESQLSPSGGARLVGCTDFWEFAP